MDHFRVINHLSAQLISADPQKKQQRAVSHCYLPGCLYRRLYCRLNKFGLAFLHIHIVQHQLIFKRYDYAGKKKLCHKPIEVPPQLKCDIKLYEMLYFKSWPNPVVTSYLFRWTNKIPVTCKSAAFEIEMKMYYYLIHTRHLYGDFPNFHNYFTV